MIVFKKLKGFKKIKMKIEFEKMQINPALLIEPDF